MTDFTQMVQLQNDFRRTEGIMCRHTVAMPTAVTDGHSQSLQQKLLLSSVVTSFNGV